MKWLVWAGVTLLFVVILLGYRAWQGAEPAAPVVKSAAPAAPNYFRQGVPQGQSDVAPSDDQVEPQQRDQAMSAPPMDAQQLNWRAQQMREAFLHGDDRAPPLAARGEQQQRVLPTAEELADPELYQQYEARQYQTVRESFVRAAARQIAELEQQLQQARALEGDPAQLAEGQEKLDRLREQYQQTLQESPELQALIEQVSEQSAEAAGDAAPLLAPDEDGPPGDATP